MIWQQMIVVKIERKRCALKKSKNMATICHIFILWLKHFPPHSYKLLIEC